MHIVEILQDLFLGANFNMKMIKNEKCKSLVSPIYLKIVNEVLSDFPSSGVSMRMKQSIKTSEQLSNHSESPSEECTVHRREEISGIYQYVEPLPT